MDKLEILHFTLPIVVSASLLISCARQEYVPATAGAASRPTPATADPQRDDPVTRLIAKTEREGAQLKEREYQREVERRANPPNDAITQLIETNERDANGSTLPSSLSPREQMFRMMRYRQEIANQMRDPNSTQFRSLSLRQTIKGRNVVCGEFNSKNEFGGYTGFQPFFAEMSDESSRSIYIGMRKNSGSDNIRTRCGWN